MALTPTEFMSSLDEQLKTEPHRTKGLTASFQFEISGPTGGEWWIEAADGSGAVHDGHAAEATLTVRMTDEVLVGIAGGEVDGAAAYYDGQITAEGDESKLMFLGPLFGG